MLEIPYSVGLILTLYAGLYDLKTSDVQEEVPFLLISIGLFYWLITSLIYSDFTYFINSISTGILALITGLSIYCLKLWGDGDAWILGGLGFLIPAIFFEYVVNLVIVGAVYSLIYVIIYGIFNKRVKKIFKKELKKHRSSIFVITIMPFLILFISLTVLPIPILFVTYFLLISLIPLLYIYLKSVESGMIKKIPTCRLREGDVLVGAKIAGLTKRDIEKLKRTKKYVKIQNGIRYVLVFFISLLINYFVGNLFLLFH
ncbi:MAG: hypothetical protein B6U88_00475 [Candidatus Aenigmarchaeota archaeon ex4484_56]|nr:MAG: hypothetical protein B6U88_00475 [Candidatus Aenigmarchaeota archaeon ex4484_56]